MRLVVLDRDGVINHDSPDYIRSVADWRPIQGSLEAIAKLTRAGFTLAIATNQSGLGRGLYDLTALEAIHAHMLREIERAGGRIAHIAWCPHRPEEGCRCRKPKPGLVDEILAIVGIPETGWMIGDRPADLLAGKARGLRPVLVRSGQGSLWENSQDTDLPQDCLIADDLGHAASILVESAAHGDPSRQGTGD